MALAITFMVGLIASLLSPIAWIPVLRRLRLLDIPNVRSSHSAPTIRGAGLAPATGVLAALVLVLSLPPRSPLVATLLGAALLAAALGFAEDVRGLTVRTRVGAQLLLGVCLGVTLCLISGRPLYLVPLIAVAVAAYINAANFMDGVDGISALHGLVAGAHFALVGTLAHEHWLELSGVVLAAVFVGFAPWNVLRSRVFLGDVGSYLLGCLVVGIGAAAFLTGTPLLLSIAPGLPYLADTFATFVSRLRRGEPLWEAHRSHVYQRLSIQGLGHLGSASTVAAVSALCSALAFFAQGGPVQTGVTVLGTMLVLGAYLISPRLQASRRGVKERE